MAETAYFELWTQVVLQAKADLEQEPIGSILYNQAADFFVGAGEWAKSRAMVPECLDIHSDHLYRCGKDWIAARRAREGLPPELPSAARSIPTPLPLLIVLPAPEPYVHRRPRIITPRPNNPFDPFQDNKQCSLRHGRSLHRTPGGV